MGIFVDKISDQALEQLGPLQRQLSAVLLELEKGGPDYARAFRLLLAAEAAFDHGVAALHNSRRARHDQWQERQRVAIQFLEVRTAESGRRFRVVRDHYLDPRTVGEGKRYRNIPPAGQEFTFMLERVPSLTGGRYGLKARLVQAEWQPSAGPGVEHRDAWEMPLQALHQAFEEGAILELEAQPRELGAGVLRVEEHPRRGRSDVWTRNDPDLIPRSESREEFERDRFATAGPLRTIEASDDPANRDRIEELRLHLAEDDGMPPVSRELLEADATDQVQQNRSRRGRLRLEEEEVRRG